jgi:hypothetical protein
LCVASKLVQIHENLQHVQWSILSSTLCAMEKQPKNYNKAKCKAKQQSCKTIVHVAAKTKKEQKNPKSKFQTECSSKKERRKKKKKKKPARRREDLPETELDWDEICRTTEDAGRRERTAKRRADAGRRERTANLGERAPERERAGSAGAGTPDDGIWGSGRWRERFVERICRRRDLHGEKFERRRNTRREI